MAAIDEDRGGAGHGIGSDEGRIAKRPGWSFLLRCSIAVIFGKRKLCPGQVGHFGQDI